MASSAAEVAVIMSGPWEVTDHRLPGDREWRHLGDPTLDAAYHQRFLEAVDALVAGGASGWCG